MATRCDRQIFAKFARRIVRSTNCHLRIECDLVRLSTINLPVRDFAIAPDHASCMEQIKNIRKYLFGGTMSATAGQRIEDARFDEAITQMLLEIRKHIVEETASMTALSYGRF
jgi:hypothetical protein